MTPAWPDGTPRSTGGPFDVLYTGRDTAPKVPTKTDALNERKRVAERDARKARKAKLTPVAIVHMHSLSKRSRILRDNHNHSFATTLPTQADRDKTARIRGRV